MISRFLTLFISGLTLSIYFSACSKNIPDECKLGADASIFNYNSTDRQYLLHKPENLADNAPLVIVLHGRNQNAADAASFGFNAIADTAQFAVCYPQGLNCTWDNDKPGSKDVDFIRQLVAQLQVEHRFSSEHTYLAGFSEGAALCNILALEAGNVFEAVAVISGEIPYSIWNIKNPLRPIPMFFMHGLNDRTFNINGGGYADNIKLDDVVDFWREFNECTSDTIVHINDFAARRIYGKGINQNEVWYYRLRNHEHVFPGDSSAPDSLLQSDISGAQEIWTFFKKW